MVSKTYNYLRIGRSIFSGLGMILILTFVKDYFVQLMFLSSIFTINAILIYWKNSIDKKQKKPLNIGQLIMFWATSVLALGTWGVVIYYSL